MKFVLIDRKDVLVLQMFVQPMDLDDRSVHVRQPCKLTGTVVKCPYLDHLTLWPVCYKELLMLAPNSCIPSTLASLLRPTLSYDHPFLSVWDRGCPQWGGWS